MKHLLLSLLSLTLASKSLATPVDANDLQTLLSELPEYPYVIDSILGEATLGVEKTAKTILDEVSKVVFGAGEKIEQWMEDGREFIRQHDHTCAYQS